VTEVTIRIPALRGLFRIKSHDKEENVYVASGSRYLPFEMTAPTLGDAVNTFLTNCNRLQLDPEVKLRDKIKGEKIQATRKANILAAANNGEQPKDKSKKPAKHDLN
jgi:hypothetical protein